MSTNGWNGCFTRAEKVAVIRALRDFVAQQTGEHRSIIVPSPWRGKFVLFEELAAEFNAQWVVHIEHVDCDTADGRASYNIGAL